MFEIFKVLIDKYLSANYFHYNFLLHNIWDIKIEEFLSHFVNEKLFLKEVLIFDSDEFSRESIFKISELLNKTSIFSPDLYKTIIIHNIDRLDKIYVNALLKIIEEPSSAVIFFLTVENIHKVIETVKSRCFAIDIRRTVIDERFKLEREKISFTLSTIYDMFFEKDDILKKIYNFYNQQINSDEIMNQNYVKKLLKSMIVLEKVAKMEMNGFNCDDKFLLLDLLSFDFPTC